MYIHLTIMDLEYISKNTIRRIAKDVKDIKNNNLHNHGIYYHHSNDNVMNANVMIIGNEHTPYYNGFYFFDILFPNNYPFSPPTIHFNTNDGKTRFNPNLYRNGKVCLSILNTWFGEQWSSCQTIRSILLYLSSIFNSNPLLNEPGVNINHLLITYYNEYISFKNIQFTIYHNIHSGYIQNNYSHFYDIAISHFKNNFSIIIDNIHYNIKNNKHLNKTFDISIYNMNNCFIDYNNILINLNTLYKKLN